MWTVAASAVRQSIVTSGYLPEHGALVRVLYERAMLPLNALMDNWQTSAR